MSGRRVVVTGAGTVNPLGLGVEESWSNALSGRSGVGAITLFDAGRSPVRIAAEVKGLDVTAPLAAPIRDAAVEEVLHHAVLPKEEKRFGRFTHLGVIAGLQAYQDAGLSLVRGTVLPHRMGVNVGVGLGGLPEIQETFVRFQEKGYRRISPFFVLQSLPNIVTGQLSVLLGLAGPSHCHITACAASAHAIGESFRAIREGRADVMLAGGAEAVICDLGVGGFAAMHALSTRNDHPAAASRPFDRGRDGFVMGEGSTVLVLEEYAMARGRGAKIYGEILGYGATSDAFHLAAPSPEGEGAGRAMEEALLEARLSPAEVGYVNAHATSTPAGDAGEARAISRVLGRGRTKPLLVSATKSMTGHLLGAAGATEALFTLLSLRDQKAPPTINLEDLDPACRDLGIDFVPGAARDVPIKNAISNSFGFGGTNGCLLFGRV